MLSHCLFCFTIILNILFIADLIEVIHAMFVKKGVVYSGEKKSFAGCLEKIQ